jgi:hypothetical protein
MTDQFGEAGDSSTNTQQTGTTFGNEGPSDKGGTNGQVGTPDDVEALRRRDEHAQAHIVRLESENSELRNKVVEIENKLANAKTVEDVLSRMNKPDTTGSASVDPDKLADAVEARLSAKELAKHQEANWASVYTKVTEIFGTWDKANLEIQAKAKELGMNNQDATTLAQRSPDAFYELFLPKSSTSNTAGSTRSAGVGQQAASTHTGEVRNQAYYTNLRHTNENKYWSVETQAQYRRDKASGLVK